MNTPSTQTLVVGFVGLALLTSLVLIGVLAINSQSIPNELGSVPLACVTGLLGLLVNTRERPPDTTP